MCRTSYSRSDGVQDFEGGADVGADPSDVLLFSTHVAVLRTTGLSRGNEREGLEHRVPDMTFSFLLYIFIIWLDSKESCIYTCTMLLKIEKKL